MGQSLPEWDSRVGRSVGLASFRGDFVLALRRDSRLRRVPFADVDLLRLFVTSFRSARHNPFDNDQPAIRAKGRQFLVQLSLRPRSACVCHANESTTMTMMTTTMTTVMKTATTAAVVVTLNRSLAVQSSKLSLSPRQPVARARHTQQTHTHTRSERGDNRARSQRAALCMRTRLYRQKARGSA